MNGRIRLNAVGDVMLGDFPLTLGFGVKSVINNGLVKNPFDKIEHVLKDCDICFGNLETVLSDYGLKNKDIRSTQMRGDASFVEFLKDSGFTVMSIANNHAMQHGQEAFVETETLLSKSGITTVGLADAANKCVPRFIKSNGIRICILGYSLRPEKYAKQSLYAHSSVPEIIEEVKLQKKSCDIIIISLHWGDEFVQIPSPEQICDAHSIIDAGASLIIGHHPHILQGIERYKQGLIAYSLGNFVFDFWQNKYKNTIILHCELSKSGVETFKIIPIRINKNYQPVVLVEREADDLLKKIDVLSEKIKNADIGFEERKKQYLSSVKNGLIINKIENRVFFLRNIIRYELWIVFQSLKNFVIPRI